MERNKSSADTLAERSAAFLVKITAVLSLWGLLARIVEFALSDTIPWSDGGVDGVPRVDMAERRHALAPGAVLAFRAFLPIDLECEIAPFAKGGRRADPRAEAVLADWEGVFSARKPILRVGVAKTEC